MNLALFDFDGTISSRDSYLFFTHDLGRRRYYQGCLLLSPYILGYLAGMYPNHALKEDFLKFFYRGKTVKELQEKAERFCSGRIPSIIRPGAMERIRWHKDRGDVVAVVSACPRLILQPWCVRIRADIVATELEVDARERITGRIAGKNCWGREKVVRIHDHYDLQGFDSIFAYGDSKGDLPMLQLADQDKRFYKPFR